MFLIILAVGIFSAIVQILSSLSVLRNPGKQGIASVTVNGWVFYVFTILLAILPGIQKLLQDDIDEKKDKETKIAQDLRDEMLRFKYDSSLLTMKAKFDTTTVLISETLGKYGFRLDSTNRLLVYIRDSAKTRVVEQPSPILQLANYPTDPAIRVVEILPNNIYEVGVKLESVNAPSAHFDVKFSFALGKSITELHGVDIIKAPAINPEMKMALTFKQESYFTVPDLDKWKYLFIRISGSYKRIDGTGKFKIDDLWCYDVINKEALIVGNPSKSFIVTFIEKHSRAL